MKIKSKVEIVDFLKYSLDNARETYRRYTEAYKYYKNLPEGPAYKIKLEIAEAKLIQIECICVTVGIIEEGTI